MMIEFDSHTLWVKVKKQEGIGKMKFSLIIGTLNRCRELEICLESLRKQGSRLLISRHKFKSTAFKLVSYNDVSSLKSSTFVTAITLFIAKFACSFSGIGGVSEPITYTSHFLFFV